MIWWSMEKNGVFWRLDHSESSSSSPPDNESEKAVHVLAVDDSLVDRKVIERLLNITSFKVTAVDSGWRALQFLGLDSDEESIGFDVRKVDLIITDYCMPGMTGYDLLKKIKGSSNLRTIPVVIMSSENVVARIDRCLEEGAEDFIVKPVKLADIRRLKNAMFGEGCNVKIKPQESSTSSLASPTRKPSIQSPTTSPQPQKDFISRTKMVFSLRQYLKHLVDE